MAKYAPAIDGLKPYIVTISSWGKSWDRIIYAESAPSARYKGVNRQKYTFATARRATPDDMEAAERAQPF